ncbi:DUF383-domain-containing protein [Stereum hirsutum FP-91666 SS1]|uniref:DUF383-domain-containing protein n=1 Tax=Stereum hirsutum (strain FP-91666) TaxID=721885 RepID=UPI000440A513|nr:DUF383-domain-containing protein [Stereum hirsutum FP-91666 SS1]EIM86519.1 DUF383-domain-containing protein [Stereum hirsutum FP-91666 SS1]
MEAQLRELLPFLHDPNPQARQLALENLLAQTPKGSPHRTIFLSGMQGGGLKKPKDSEVIRDLKLLCRDNLAVAHDAFRALVNLSDSPLLVTSLAEPTFLNFLVSYIINPQATLADLAAMLLSNLTTAISSSTAAALLSMKVKVIPYEALLGGLYPTNSRSGSCAAPVPYPQGEEVDVPALPLLLDAFVRGANIDPDNEEGRRRQKSSLHFLASVFANVSTTPVGRQFLWTPQHIDLLRSSGPVEFPLSKIVAFTEHKDTIRRGGVASTIKNCSFEKQAHQALLSPETDLVIVPPSTIKAPGVDALPFILLPLAGPEEFDLEDQELLPAALQFLPPTKQREADPTLRLTHVETLLLLCTTRWGRDFLRNHGVYEIVRALHEQETVDNISEHIERLVNLLKGDEGPETVTEGQIEEVDQGEIDEDEVIEEV